MGSDYTEWDTYYRELPLEELGWELGKPRPILVEYIESGATKKGEALDVCCGAGTNTIYMAKKGFNTTAVDISKTAIKIAKERAVQANVNINFLIESFVDLSFRDERFDFIFDMGCFHHVEVEERTRFIYGVQRVLKNGGVYMLTCFSYRNGLAWNHFTRQQLIEMFSGYFRMGEFRHYASVEGDRATRYFYTVLMRKREKKQNATM